MTPRGYEYIRRELQWLETEERPKVVKEVAYAASLGDRSENAEYIYGKKRLRQIDHRVGRRLVGRGQRLIFDETVQPVGREEGLDDASLGCPDARDHALRLDAAEDVPIDNDDDSDLGTDEPKVVSEYARQVVQQAMMSIKQAAKRKEVKLEDLDEDEAKRLAKC